MSSMGTPCTRKLWYSVNQPDDGEPLPTSARVKFLYGDILESFLISLAIAAGHRVEGLQGVLEIAGIKGHRDCVIDGVTVDVKSASPFGFNKFKSGGLRGDDPFGYISQLSSYVYAGRDDPVVTDKTHGAFLAIDKVGGHICLDMYDLTEEMENKEEEFEDIKVMVTQEVPDRTFEPIPDGKSGNTKLGVNCSYCDYNKVCHPDLRTFLYSAGPRFLIDVVKLPMNKYGPIREVT